MPRAAARRRAIADALSSVFYRWGYERIVTPVVEVAEVLDRGLGQADRATAVRFVEPFTGQVVALRPDITPQIARIAATRVDGRGFPSRFSYEGAVTRVNRRTGGHREELQCGIEIIDLPSPVGDAEALAVAASALEACHVGQVRLDLGHVAFSRFAMERCPEAERPALETALLRKDAGAVRELTRSWPRAVRAVAQALPTLYGPRDDVLERVHGISLPGVLSAAVAEIEDVLELSAALVPGALHRSISLDLGEVRGFDYYTGLRFRGFADGAGQAILRGGRYDELVGRYGRAAAATGFAVDVEAVAEAQEARGTQPGARESGLYVISPPARRAGAQAMAATLRAAGHRVLVQIASAGERTRATRHAREGGWSRIVYWDQGWRGLSPDGGGEDGIMVVAPDRERGPLTRLIRWIESGE